MNGRSVVLALSVGVLSVGKASETTLVARADYDASANWDVKKVLGRDLYFANFWPMSRG